MSEVEGERETEKGVGVKKALGYQGLNEYSEG